MFKPEKCRSPGISGSELNKEGPWKSNILYPDVPDLCWALKQQNVETPKPLKVCPMEGLPLVWVGNQLRPRHPMDSDRLGLSSPIIACHLRLLDHLRFGFSRLTQNEHRISWYPLFFSAYFSRGTLPTKKGERRAPSWGS